MPGSAVPPPQDRQILRRANGGWARDLCCLLVAILLIPIATTPPNSSQDYPEALQKGVERANKIAACHSDPACLERLFLTPDGSEGEPRCKVIRLGGKNCLPVTATVAHSIDYQDVAYAGSRDETVNCRAHLSYEAAGLGQLIYDDDFQTFTLEVYGTGGTKVGAYDGFQYENALKRKGRITFGGPGVVHRPFKLTIIRGPGDAEKTNIEYNAPLIGLGNPAPGLNPDFPNCTDTGGPHPGMPFYHYPGGAVVFTPELMQQIVSSRSFQRTYQFRLDRENKAYTDHVLTLSLALGEGPRGPKLVVAPREGLTMAGPDKSGNFNPSAKTYTLTNSGQEPLDYKVAKSRDWLTLSRTSGNLPPGASDQVAVSLDESAQKLKAGKYKDQVEFTNATNGQGNTTRPVALNVGETQVWSVKLTGQETDDIGGKLMYMKLGDLWKVVAVNYGIQFGYTLQAQFTIQKQEGAWEYSSGQILSGKVGLGDLFDPNIFTVTKIKCLNCDAVANLAGASLPGEADGNTVRLFWPKVVPQVEVTNSIRLVFKADQKIQQGPSTNLFESAEFFQRTSDHYLPLQEGEKTFQITKTSYADRYKLDKRPPISISYRYLLHRIQ